MIVSSVRPTAEFYGRDLANKPLLHHRLPTTVRTPYSLSSHLMMINSWKWLMLVRYFLRQKSMVDLGLSYNWNRK